MVLPGTTPLTVVATAAHLADAAVMKVTVFGCITACPDPAIGLVVFGSQTRNTVSVAVGTGHTAVRTVDLTMLCATATALGSRMETSRAVSEKQPATPLFRVAMVPPHMTVGTAVLMQLIATETASGCPYRVETVDGLAGIRAIHTTDLGMMLVSAFRN